MTQSYSLFDNSRFTVKINVEIMRGLLWWQCFCLLMRRELSFLSVCNFLVWPWPWQLACVKQINPQHSLRWGASGLCTPYALGAPWSLFSPLLTLSAVFTSATVQRTWGMFVLFSSPFFSLSSFPLLLSPPEYQTMSLHLPPHLDFTSLFSSISTTGCSPSPHVRARCSLRWKAAAWTSSSLPWSPRYFLLSAK